MGLSAAHIGTGGYLTTVEDHRNLVDALTSGQSGRLTEADFVLTPAAPEYGLALAASKGRAALKGANHVAQGSYFVHNQEPDVIAWPAPSSQPRIDTVLLLVADGQYGALTVDPGPHWVVAEGVPAASPVRLSDAALQSSWAQPGAYVPWADVVVNPGDTAFVPGDITMRAPTLNRERLFTLIQQPAGSVAVWPSSSGGNHYVGTAEQLIGGGTWPNGAVMKKTFTVQPARCYEVMMHCATVDGGAGSTPGQDSAEIVLRYGTGTATPSAGVLFGRARVPLMSDDNTKDGSGTAFGYMNGLTPGTYTVAAFLKSFTATGTRLFSPYVLAIKDVGPSFAEG